jgi:hypothetical protein
MSTVRRLLFLPFWLAVLLTVLGYVISFVPGADCGWFLVVAGLSCSGLFIPRASYRSVSGLLLILALASAYSGYRHGVEYRQRLSIRQAEK